MQRQRILILLLFSTIVSASTLCAYEPETAVRCRPFLDSGAQWAPGIRVTHRGGGGGGGLTNTGVWPDDTLIHLDFIPSGEKKRSIHAQLRVEHVIDTKATTDWVPLPARNWSLTVGEYIPSPSVQFLQRLHVTGTYNHQQQQHYVSGSRLIVSHTLIAAGDERASFEAPSSPATNSMFLYLTLDTDVVPRTATPTSSPVGLKLLFTDSFSFQYVPPSPPLVLPRLACDKQQLQKELAESCARWIWFTDAVFIVIVALGLGIIYAMYQRVMRRQDEAAGKGSYEKVPTIN